MQLNTKSMANKEVVVVAVGVGGYVDQLISLGIDLEIYRTDSDADGSFFSNDIVIVRNFSESFCAKTLMKTESSHRHSFKFNNL